MRVIKSRRKGWAGHVTRMGKGDVHKMICWGNLTDIHVEDLNVDNRIILKGIYNGYDVGVD
jgi:hypothetical protein